MRGPCGLNVSGREPVAGALGGPGPGHEFVETRGGPQIDELGEHVGEVGLRIDAVQLAGFDERGDTGPVLRTLIVAGEQRVLAIKRDGADAALDDVGVEFDAAVVEEPSEPVPMAQAVADGFGDQGLTRDARELLFEPGFERQHKRLAPFLAHRATLAGAVPPDRLLDRIERRDARESFAGDRSGAVLGDFEEPASQVGPAESERDRLAACCVGNALVGGISVALHDAAIVLEQLQGVNRAATGGVAVGDGRRIRPAPGPVVTSDGPEVSFLSATAAGIEHRRHGLIDRDLARGEDELAQPKVERLELGGRIAHPERQDRAPDVEALREQHLGLPIER